MAKQKQQAIESKESGSKQANQNQLSVHTQIYDLPNHIYYLDNMMIEAYYSMQERFDRDEQIQVLEQDTLLNYLKQIRKELNYLIGLPFVKFWAEIVKDEQILDFLDDFLSNVRKHNDVLKLKPELVKHNKDGMEAQTAMQMLIRENMS